jgi:Fur family ferric uptake transcriptional regulator
MTVSPLTPTVRASSVAAACTALRARGLRLSSARRQLLHALYAADEPLTAEQLAGDGDVASAYRNLEVLEQLGLVAHVHLGHGPGRYQPASRPSAFVRCERCGEVRPLPPAAVDAVRAAVWDAVGYDTRVAHFPIAGLCPLCSTIHDTPEEPACSLASAPH